MSNTSFQFTSIKLPSQDLIEWVALFVEYNPNPTTHIHPKLFFTKHRSTMNKFRHKRSFEWKSHENDWFSQFYKQRSKIVLISIDNRENTHRCHHGSLMTLRKCTRFIEKYTETVRVELRACMLLLLVKETVCHPACNYYIATLIHIKKHVFFDRIV